MADARANTIVDAMKGPLVIKDCFSDKTGEVLICDKNIIANIKTMIQDQVQVRETKYYIVDPAKKEITELELKGTSISDRIIEAQNLVGEGAKHNISAKPDHYAIYAMKKPEKGSPTFRLNGDLSTGGFVSGKALLIDINNYYGSDFVKTLVRFNERELDNGQLDIF